MGFEPVTLQKSKHTLYQLTHAACFDIKCHEKKMKLVKDIPKSKKIWPVFWQACTTSYIKS